MATVITDAQVLVGAELVAHLVDWVEEKGRSKSAHDAGMCECKCPLLTSESRRAEDGNGKSNNLVVLPVNGKGNSLAAVSQDEVRSGAVVLCHADSGDAPEGLGSNPLGDDGHVCVLCCLKKVA